MGRQGNIYEKTVAFILIPYIKEGEDLQSLPQIFLQESFSLPFSKKIYKATRKNISLYIKEYLELNPKVKCIRIDRISHIDVVHRPS